MGPNVKYIILCSYISFIQYSAASFGDEAAGAGSLGCYKCTSYNGSNPNCDDEFVARRDFYSPSCMAARKSYRDGKQNSQAVRIGLYPATHCIKFKAVNKETRETILVRDCATDGGGTTYDTEIGGMSHCGILMKEIIYDGKPMEGCIMTCKSSGCNIASIKTAHPTIIVILLLFVFTVFS